MQERLFREYCQRRQFDAATTEAAVQAVKDFEGYVTVVGVTLETVTAGHLADYLEQLSQAGTATEERLIALARYAYVTHRNELFVQLVHVAEAPDILPVLRARIRQIAGDEAADRVFQGIHLPAEGSPIDAYPPVVEEIVGRIKDTLPDETRKQVLAGNMHQIPETSFADMKERFQRNPDIEAFLADRHTRLVQELEDHMNQGTLWYEQEITPAVLQYVREHPEIQSGVRHGDVIHVAKIPFNPQAYLDEKDPTRKRYEACHCPLARSSISAGRQAVSPLFCYCSAGYEKLPFEAIFGEPVQVEVLESALGGSDHCRFAITIPERFRKTQ
ncbi:MAG TPA: hypothetical protein VN478_01350 [Clostridia bacterium]|nr:hypothetical protein [Clostridia bacterium]